MTVMDSEVDVGDSIPLSEGEKGSPARVSFLVEGSTEGLHGEGRGIEP